MIGRLRDARYILSAILSLVGIGVVIYYKICAGTCSYLRGNVFGLDLAFMGIAALVAILVLSILRYDRLLTAGLGAGVGGEIVLVAFQVSHDTYCPYCLAFGAIVIVLFLLNFDLRRWLLAAACVVLGFLVFLLFFEGQITPTYALYERRIGPIGLTGPILPRSPALPAPSGAGHWA